MDKIEFETACNQLIILKSEFAETQSQVNCLQAEARTKLDAIEAIEHRLRSVVGRNIRVRAHTSGNNIVIVEYDEPKPTVLITLTEW